MAPTSTCLAPDVNTRTSSVAIPSQGFLTGLPMDILYRDNAAVSVELAIDLYNRSTLGERRPVDRPDIFEAMLMNASLTVTAWHGERLVGIARSLTDFSYVAYLADLAVDEAYQKQGIGKRLIEETRQ